MANSLHSFLEEVNGEDAIDWVKQCNERAIADLGEPKETRLYSRALAMMDSKEKIPYVRKVGRHYYNLWKDADHQRGLWRRTTLDEYRKGEDAAWETVLDVDALGKEEGESYVWKGYSVLDEGPGHARGELCLLKLSRGGADATIVREFNLCTKRFVCPARERGFELPEAKSSVSWKTRDVLMVGTDFGEGSMTDSGYPRTVREWRRGTPLAEATLVFEGEAADVAVGGYCYYDRGQWIELRRRSMTFYTTEYHHRLLPASPAKGDGGNDSEWRKLALPEDAEVSTFREWLVVSLRSEWSAATHLGPLPAGSLVALHAPSFTSSSDMSSAVALFVPSARVSLKEFEGTRNMLVLSLLDNVKSAVRYWRFNADAVSPAGVWRELAAEGTAAGSSEGGESGSMDMVSVWAVDSDETDEMWSVASGFLRPSTLSLVGEAGPNAAEETLWPVLSSSPSN